MRILVAEDEASVVKAKMLHWTWVTGSELFHGLRPSRPQAIGNDDE